MRSVMKLSIPVMVLVLAAFALTTAQAGQIAAPFAEMLQSTSGDDFVRGIVILRSQADVRRLSAQMDALDARMPVRHEFITRMLQETAAREQKDLLATVQKIKKRGLVKQVRPFWISNMIALEAKPEVFYELEKRGDVGEIQFDYQIELIEPVAASKSSSKSVDGVENGLVVIRAPELWALGVTGAGTLVSNLDTGVAGSHAALATRWRGLEPGVDPSAAWYDPVTSTDFPFDSGSHGTHTMGTITGRDGDDIIGVAYDAKWIAAGVIDRVSIQQTLTDAIAAFQWAADPDGNPGTFDDVPDVISNSWGLIPVTHGVPECDSQLWGVIDNVEAAGSIVVFAAGNEGCCNNIRIPADRIAGPVNVFSVGALNQNGTTIASFSSQGPSDCDDTTIKPEICAVGVDVRSSVPSGYSTMSGTSMATPHVAGAIALLRQANPDATAEEVKTALYVTAIDLGAGGEDNVFGMGRIDLVEALSYLGIGGNIAQIEGTVTETGSGDPIPLVTIRLDGTSYQTTTNNDGEYKFLALGDETYTVVAEAFGYISDSETIYATAGEVTVVDLELAPTPRSSISGTTKDDSGNVLEGVQISLTNVSWPDAYSAADGTYSMVVPGDYTYDMMAYKSDYDEAYAEDVYVPTYGGVTVDFVLEEEGLCFLKAAIGGPHLADALEPLYHVRDRLLAGNKVGERYIAMYSKHSAQMLRIAVENPALLADTLAAVRVYSPLLETVADAGSLDSVRLDPEVADAVTGLLERYMSEAGPELTRDLLEVIGKINAMVSPIEEPSMIHTQEAPISQESMILR